MTADEFRQQCRDAGVADDKPLSQVLLTVFVAAETALSSVKAGARGLTAEGEADLIRRVVKTIDAQSRQSLAQHRLRLDRKGSWIAGGVVAVSLLLGGVGGYWWGWSTGQQSVAVLERDIGAAFQSGPDGAAAWLRLMRHNNLPQALAQCSGNAVWSANGRQACLVPLWLDGSGAPEVNKEVTSR
jgi:hypothetical protein